MQRKEVTQSMDWTVQYSVELPGQIWGSVYLKFRF